MIDQAPGARFVPKSWGYERWVVNTPRYCGKVLQVARGQHCSWHYHANKDETFLVQRGELVAWLAETSVELLPTRALTDELTLRAHTRRLVLFEGDSLHVPPGHVHRFEAVTDTVLVEFSTFHEDGDSHRLTFPR